MHGFAFNCNPDLSWGDVIIPCGIPDAGVTSLSRELERDVPVLEVLPHVEKHLADILPTLQPNRRVRP
jgi:lipoyl(octanoyl) transferase